MLLIPVDGFVYCKHVVVHYMHGICCTACHARHFTQDLPLLQPNKIQQHFLSLALKSYRSYGYIAINTDIYISPKGVTLSEAACNIHNSMVMQTPLLAKQLPLRVRSLP